MKQNYLPHLAARVFGVPLLIQIDKLMVILDAIGPRIGTPRTRRGRRAAGRGDAARSGRRRGGRRDAAAASGRKPYPVTPDGIAVISDLRHAGQEGVLDGRRIRPPVLRDDPRPCSRTPATIPASGASCSTWTRLAARSAVCSISRTRCTPPASRSPCYAIANDEAFSAAYALASSAQRLFVTRTGGVGSIGVIAVHMDQSGWDEKMGRKYTAVYAGARKNDFSTHQPLSDDARANLQGEVDRLYEMFVASVARNRGPQARAGPEHRGWPVLGRESHQRRTRGSGWKF